MAIASVPPSHTDLICGVKSVAAPSLLRCVLHSQRQLLTFSLDGGVCCRLIVLLWSCIGRKVLLPYFLPLVICGGGEPCCPFHSFLSSQSLLSYWPFFLCPCGPRTLLCDAPMHPSWLLASALALCGSLAAGSLQHTPTPWSRLCCCLGKSPSKFFHHTTVSPIHPKSSRVVSAERRPWCAGVWLESVHCFIPCACTAL